MTATVKAESLIAVGRITKTLGLKGKVRVLLYTPGLQTLKGAKRIFLKGPDGSFENHAVAELSLNREAAVMKIDDIDDIAKAGSLKKMEVFVEKAGLGPLKEGEYYQWQLLGMEVADTSGKVLGKISAIIATGSNDVMEVSAEGKSFLIPMLDSVIVEVDTSRSVMTVTLRGWLKE